MRKSAKAVYIVIAVLIAILLSLSACLPHPTKSPSIIATHSTLPVHSLTPGATRKGTLAQLCTPGSSTHARNVPLRVKREVYRSYGILHWTKGQFEVDHLVSLELLGSNDITNLWPEAYTGEWNAHDKDKLENRLHAMVCSHELPLATAQQWIAEDWIKAYKRVFGVSKP